MPLLAPSTARASRSTAIHRFVIAQQPAAVTIRRSDVVLLSLLPGEHPGDHRSAALGAAWPGCCSRLPPDLVERGGAPRDHLLDHAATDLVADADDLVR